MTLTVFGFSISLRLGWLLAVIWLSIIYWPRNLKAFQAVESPLQISRRREAAVGWSGGTDSTTAVGPLSSVAVTPFGWVLNVRVMHVSSTVLDVGLRRAIRPSQADPVLSAEPPAKSAFGVPAT